MTKSMTSGSPMKLILGFSIPLLFGSLFQQFYSLVDTLIVGRVLGVNSLAAVGSTGSINFLIIGFCMGVCNGLAIPMAHKFGAEDFPALRKSIANAIYLSVIFAVVMTILTVVFCRQILVVMKTPADIIEEAYVYIVIIFAGIPVTYLYNLVSGILRSIGDSKTPVVFLVIASVINIGLDLLLMMVIPMGVAGAAIATVAAQAISGIGCLLYTIKKYEFLHPREDEWKWNGSLVTTMLGMGIPMGLQYSVTAIGSVILQTAVNTLGSMAVAAMTAGGRINMFFGCPTDAMGATMSTYGGQNVGARKLERVSQGLKACTIIGFVYSILAVVIIALFGKQLSLLFVSADEVEIIGQVYQFLIIQGVFYFPLALVNIIRFLIQGMGYSKLAIVSGVFEMIARAVVGFAFVPVFGYTAACFASPLAWIMADVFLIPAYRHVYKKTAVLLKYQPAKQEAE